MLGGAIQTVGSLTRRLTVGSYSYSAIGVTGTLKNAYSRSAVIVIATLAVLAALFFNDLKFHLGWSVIPLLLWSAAAIIILNVAPHLLKTQWRYAFSATFIGLAIVGVLGSLQVPNYFSSSSEIAINQSYGGSFGNYVARWPLDWSDSGGTSSQLALAFSRVGVLVLIAAAGSLPRHALITVHGIWVGLVAFSVLLIVAGAGIVSRILAWRANRGVTGPTAEELMNEAAVGTEADQIEYPSFTTGKPEPPLTGNVRPDLLVTQGDPAAEKIVDPTARTITADVETLIDDEDDSLGLDNEMGEDGTFDGVPGLLAPILPGFLHVPPFTWPLPDIGILKTAPAGGVPESEIEATSELIVETLADHGIEVSVGDVREGPRVTMYGIVPGWGRGRGSAKLVAEQAPGNERSSGRQRVRVDNILAREKDLALSLASPSLRFEAPVPGASLVGIEVPNPDRETVYLREMVESESFRKTKGVLAVAMGKDIFGNAVTSDLAKMPHLLVAGTTGSGKSVGLNAMILSILFKASPKDVRLIMVDPKMLELAVYEDIPHLLTPVVTDMKDAANALRWCVAEMERRYRLMASLGVRNVGGFNRKVKDAEKAGSPIK
ncbi:MAG TPA: hypothetical protein EYQ82_06805, partial [Dehalococcoidia bacterium]|nr:hypothetical protein [Dehalococcoidia bacterium]